MGLNWRGGLRAAFGAAGDVSALMINDEVAKQREARMAQYRSQEQATGFGYQAALQGQQLEAQGVMTDRKIAADQEQAIIEREQEVSDMARKEGHDMRLAEFKAMNDPRASTVTVNNNGQDLDARTEEFSKAIGKADAEMYTAIRTSAQSAVQMEDSLNVLEQIQQEFETGKTQQALATLGQYAGTDAGSAMQAWEGTISPIVLAKAESLSGVLSDKDMEFLKASVPQFGLDKKANAIMIGLMRKGMERAIENEKSMQSHLNKYGNLNDWTAPNQQGTMINATESAQTNIGAVDDILGLFK